MDMVLNPGTGSRTISITFSLLGNIPIEIKFQFSQKNKTPHSSPWPDTRLA